MNTTYNTFAISFYINHNKIKKNGLCPLMGRITINTEISQFSAQIDIDPLLWNAKTHVIKGRSNYASYINNQINQLKTKIKEYYRKTLDRQGYVTAKLIKDKIKETNIKKKNILELFREYNDKYIQKASLNCIENYRNIYNHLKSFIETHYNMKDIPLKQLNLTFIEKFDSYLRIKNNFSASTISNFTIILRKIANHAIKQGTLHSNPFEAYIPEQPHHKYNHMTKEELNKLMQTPINSKFLCHTRDMFIFCSFTGLSFADLKNLSENQIYKENGEFWIQIKCQQTNNERNIMLLEIPSLIINKYQKERNSDKIFNIASNSSINKNLVIIAQLCRIEKHITFSMSKYNFAILITLSQDVPLETVHQMMGNKCIKTTQNYINMTHQNTNRSIKKIAAKTTRKYKLSTT